MLRTTKELIDCLVDFVTPSPCRKLENMILLKFVRSYLVPGAVFQSIVVGGGYGTGREIVQYFTNYGPYGGLLGIFVAFAMFALVLCFTFEIARQFKAFD